MENETSVLEKLLGFYHPCFDLKRPFAVGETVYDAYAFCDVTSSRYVLIERAELWRAYTFEHVFFRETDLFSRSELQEYERQLREQIEPEFVRKGQKYPIPNHMCTYLTGIFICHQAVSGDTVRAIRKHRFRLNYRFALRGYCESRLVVLDLDKKQIYGNAAAKSLAKRLKQQLTSLEFDIITGGKI